MSNLTGRPVYQRQPKRTKSNRPTVEQRHRWSKLIALGCIIVACPRRPGIHHCKTGRGGTKDHDKVLPLCHFHHQGEQGIHTLSRRVWEPIYGSEDELMDIAAILLGEKSVAASVD